MRFFNKILWYYFLITFFHLFSIHSYAQTSVKEELLDFKNLPRFGWINEFYQLNGNKLVWFGKSSLLEELLDCLQSAGSVGLDERDYQFSFIKRYQDGLPLESKKDSVAADVYFSDAAIHFFTDAGNGTKAPAFAFTGLSYRPEVIGVIRKLAAQTRKGNLQGLLTMIEPVSGEYHQLRQRLNWFNRIMDDSEFREVKIASTIVDSTNKLLLQRLYQLGVIDTVNTAISRKELTQKVKEAQSLFDVRSDGVISTTTLQALNIPLRIRIEELKKALNYLRWLEQIKKDSSVLILNLPSAELLVYDKGKVILYSKVVVGKKATPTPCLTSTIKQVILYPYWTVPHRIATKELLPSIKKNVAFLTWGNYQVLNLKGKVVNPKTINWSQLGASYFPYIIRQSTGCDNALGLVKFNFENPFNVYLHDTPAKALFFRNKRYFSHGCMRVEKPFDLARLLLGINRIAIDTLTAKGCLYQQAPIVVPVNSLPVIVLYSTAWYTKEGHLRFYDDVYRKNNQQEKRIL